VELVVYIDRPVDTVMSATLQQAGEHTGTSDRTDSALSCLVSINHMENKSIVGKLAD
jgi:hypothetical protein